MSGGLSVLELSEDDLRLMLVAEVFMGETNLNYQMSGYVYGRTKEGNHIIKVNKTWEKILLAARAIAAVDNTNDVCAIGCKTYTQRAVLKFANYTRSSSIAGRFTPGAFTNQKQSANSIAVVWWLLAREVRRMRGEDIRTQPWSVMVDLFRYRDPTEEETPEVEEAEEHRLEPAGPGADADATENWAGDPSLPITGLGEMGIPATGFGPVGGAPAGGWSNLDADPTDAW